MRLPCPPYAVLSPLGEWRERLNEEAMKHGLLASNNLKPAEEWEDEVRKILKEYENALLAVIDCHH